MFTNWGEMTDGNYHIILSLLYNNNGDGNSAIVARTRQTCTKLIVPNLLYTTDHEVVVRGGGGSERENR